MKRLFNKLVLGLVIGAICALSAANIMAQDDAAKTALYTKFTECYKAQDEAGMIACIAVGKDYMAKYGTPPDQYSEFVSKQTANLEKKLRDLPLKNAYAKLDSGIKAKRWGDVFAAGREVISLEPKDSTKLDVTLFLATIGYDLAFANPPDNTYNAEGLNYAKSAIRMIESGVVSEPRPGPNNTTLEATWGGTGNYAYKTKDNALAWMNFAAARLTADTNKDATKNLAKLKEAAPYFYKSVQYNSDIKKYHTSYQALGRYYLEELNAIVDQYDKTCKDLPEDTDECKRLRGMQLAYADRGLDAYARAYKIAKDDPKQTQALRDSLNKVLANFYTVRYKKPDGLNEYLVKISTQPLVDPSATVTPIIEAPVAATTPAGTTSTTPANNTTAKPPASTTKPAATPVNNSKPPATPAKPAATKGKVAKKTVAKKKTGR